MGERTINKVKCVICYIEYIISALEKNKNIEKDREGQTQILILSRVVRKA